MHYQSGPGSAHLKHQLILATFLALCFIVPASAMAATLSGRLTIDPMVLVGGNYQAGSYMSMDPNGTPVLSADSLDSAGLNGIILNTNQNFLLNPTGTGVTQEAGIVAPFLLHGASTYVGANSLSYQYGENHPVVSVEHDGFGNLTADLSAWEIFWSAIDSAFEQGPRPVNTGPFELATGTYDPGTGHYTLDWVSHFKGGSLDGQLGTWHLEGTHIAAVPIPGAFILLAPGLAGLLGIRRKRK